MHRALTLAVGLTLICGTASAQEAIDTAGGAQSHISPSAIGTANAEGPMGPTYDVVRDDFERPEMGPCGPVRHTADGKVDNSPRGQVEVGVGTGGYRHIAGAMCKPVGDHAAVSIAVSETQYQGRGGRRRW